eukprot:11175494-Lingulodinium_polyedra.AAC.1
MTHRAPRARAASAHISSSRRFVLARFVFARFVLARIVLACIVLEAFCRGVSSLGLLSARSVLEAFRPRGVLPSR